MRRSMLLLFVLGSMAYAQLGEVAISMGASKLRNDSLGNLQGPGGPAESEVTAKTNFRLAIRATFNSYTFFGHEIGYAYNRGKFMIPSGGGVTTEYGMPIHQGMYNFLAYATPEGSSIRPFGTGGVHFSTFYPPGASVFQGNGVTKFGFNFGGGVKVRVSDLFLIRFDVRDYWTGKPDFGLAPEGLLRQLEVSAGLGFAF